MARRSIYSWTLLVFACWLVLLASADDFNLARLILPFSEADAEGLLPLDDPNTDFAPSSESREPPTTTRHKRGCTSSVQQRVTRAVLASPFAGPAIGHSPWACINAPLRC